nr:Flp pilus assembly protein CpaB [Sphingorhabdus sp.]
RSLADNAAELEMALASGDVKVPNGASAEEEEKFLASVQKQPTAGPSTFATGGDVSRFQRSSVPAITPVQIATEAVKVERQIEQVRRGSVVRVSRAGAVEEVNVDRR